MVVEPYGAYTEQSLYIKYSDHGQFLGGKVLVTHKFDLPEGAVVNDLWLWIGDCVMQALILERKHAQGIWDTVTSFKRDPAYLRVDDNQYTLSVYPLESGSYRKVKMNYVVPTKFYQKTPYVDLSYKYLKGDNNQKTPLRILFRANDSSWGKPKIVEMPDLEVSGTVDTLGKKYSVIHLPDVKALSSLTLTYDINLIDGTISSISTVDSNCYFTFGMYEHEYFKMPVSDQRNKKSFVGIDISGIYGVEQNEFVSNLTTFFNAYLQPFDTMKVVLAGEGILDTFPSSGWYIANNSTTPDLLSKIAGSRVCKAKQAAVKPRILFADGDDGGGWNFKDIGRLADCKTVDDKGGGLMKAIPAMNQYDIIASYWHGLSSTLNNQQLDDLKKALDIFFENGGVFLTLFAYNRDKNHIARKYFKDLVKPPGLTSAWVHRNPDGPIGYGFPKKTYYHNCAPLNHKDPDAIDELIDEKGQPVVISKKIGKGRFILTSMWHMQDNEGLKRSLCTVLLNLQNQSKFKQLPDVLSDMVSTYGQESFTEAVIMSNSGYIANENNINTYLNPLDINAVREVAPIKSINLLDGEFYFPPVYHLDGNEYYGGAYCLKHISTETTGMFLSTHIETWNYIPKMFALNCAMQHEYFDMKVLADNVPVTHEVFKILPNLTVNRANFYTGKTPVADSITISFEVKYKGFDSLFSRSSTFRTGELDNTKDIALRTMYENELLKILLLQSPLDTNEVIKFALSNRLLCDFTAFLALEPNDTISFMVDPIDESIINPTDIVEKDFNSVLKKFTFNVFLEGFQVKFRFNSEVGGKITLKIFNLLGKSVKEKNLMVGNGETKIISIDKTSLGKGTYVAVAQFHPMNGEKNQKCERKICKFSILR